MNLIRINVKTREEKVACLFFPIVMIDYYLIMRGYNYNSILMLPIVAFITLFCIKPLIDGVASRNTGIRLVTVWLIYNLLSFALILGNDVETECFTSRIRTYLFPILFFYFGSNVEFSKTKFYKSFLYSMIFCFIIGFYLYFFTPSYYTDYLLRVRENTWYMGDTYHTAETIMEHIRFGSFFSDSYAISYFSVPSLILSFSFLFYKSERKHDKLWYFIALISLAAAILCQQRIAIALSIAIVMFFSFWGIKNDNKTLAIVFGVAIGLAISSMVMFLDKDRLSTISEMIFGRFEHMHFNEAMDDRTGQYTGIWSSWNNIVLGDGLGSHSGVAMMYGHKVVNDGEFIRVLVENGIIGILIFSTFILKSLVRAYRLNRWLLPELLVVLYFLLACIGSDALSIMFFYTPIFWFCLGRIWNKEYISNQINENNYE